MARASSLHTATDMVTDTDTVTAMATAMATAMGAKNLTVRLKLRDLCTVTRER